MNCYCKACGNIDEPVARTRWPWLPELVLFVTAIVFTYFAIDAARSNNYQPLALDWLGRTVAWTFLAWVAFGTYVSMRRLHTKDTCASCGSAEVIPEDSPIARQLLSR